MIDKIVNFAIKRKKYSKTNYLFYFNKSDKKYPEIVIFYFVYNII